MENQYARAVRRTGNAPARRIIGEVFRVIARAWRGIGEIPQSGLGLTENYAEHDAERIFGAVVSGSDEETECVSGAVLRGQQKPSDRPAFGVRCTPERPLGVTMVSSEGACAAYYRYRRTA